LFPQPIPTAAAEALLARRVLESYPGLSPRDVIHAAVVTTQNLDGIVTTGAAFAQLRGLTVFEPVALAAS
jgi:predicted nucleic acid-binding protein